MSPTISDVERDKVPLVDLIDDPYLKRRVARVCQLRDDAINAFTALSAQKSEREEWQDISTAQKDNPVSQAAREAPARDVLMRFVVSLTNGGKNRANVLTINHDELSALIKAARSALSAQPEEQWPSDGTCRQCGACPRNPSNGLCATCEDEPLATTTQQSVREAVASMIENTEVAEGLSAVAFRDFLASAFRDDRVVTDAALGGSNG